VTRKHTHQNHEVRPIMDQLISGPRQLSDDVLAHLYVYSMSDKPGHFHVLFHCSHIFIDDASALTMRAIFDVLSIRAQRNQTPRTDLPCM